MSRTDRRLNSLRLVVQELETRELPANTITITNDPMPFHIRVTEGPGSILIDTTGPAALLNLATLEAALRNRNGKDVRISSDADKPENDGDEAGSIIWPAGVGGPDLSGIKATRLTIGTTAKPGAIGDIDLTAVTFDGPAAGRLSLALIAGPAGAIRLHPDGTAGTHFGRAIDNLDILGGAGGVAIEAGGQDSVVDVSGRVTIRGASIAVPAGKLISGGAGMILGAQAIALGGTVEARDSGVVITGAVTLNADTDVRGRSVTFDDPVDGPFALTLGGDQLTFHKDVGSNVPLDTVNIDIGNALFRGDVLNAATVRIGGGPGTAIFGADGALTGNVIVAAGGVLSPGGLDRYGQLLVDGAVTFDGGIYAPDLNGDIFGVSGDVAILNGARLGAGYGMGVQPFPRKVIDWGGTLTGTFVNAPLGGPVIVGADAVKVTAYGPPGTGIVLAQVPSAANAKLVNGVDADGTEFRTTLTGSGLLVYANDAAGRQFLVVRDSGPSTALSISVGVNKGANGIVDFDGGIVAAGHLPRISAPQVNIADQFRATGPAGTIRIHSLTDTGGVGARFGLRSARAFEGATALTAKDVSMDVWVAGRLKALSLTGDFTGDLDALALGSLRAHDVSGEIVTASTSFNGSLTATGVFSGVFRSGGFFNAFRAAEVSAGAVIQAKRINALSVTGTFAGTLIVDELPRFSAGNVASGVLDGVEIGKTSIRGFFSGTLKAESLGSFVAGGASAKFDIALTGPVGSIRVTGAEASLALTAGEVGCVYLAGTLRGLEPWDVVGHVGRLTAGAIEELDATAGTMGKISVTGRAKFGLAGEIRESKFTTTGGQRLLGIESMAVSGGVFDSQFDVRRGEAGPITVGRFVRSDLVINYDPSSGFTQSWGSLSRFATTMRHSSVGPDEWAFEDSRIAAISIGSVRLSGLRTQNGGEEFGITVVVPGSVRVIDADVINDPELPLNRDLDPDPMPLAGDFYYRAS